LRRQLLQTKKNSRCTQINFAQLPAATPKIEKSEQKPPESIKKAKMQVNPKQAGTHPDSKIKKWEQIPACAVTIFLLGLFQQSLIVQG